MPPDAETPNASREVTRLLISWRGGDRAAPRELFELLYQELRRLAGALGVSERTVKRDAQEARAFLYGERHEGWRA